MVRLFLLAVACLGFGFAASASAKEVDLKKDKENEVRKVEEFLRNLGQGNERSGEVTSAKFDTDSGEIKLGIKVRCRQVSGYVYNPISRKRVPIVTYDYDLSADIFLNFKTGKTSGNVKLSGQKVIEFDQGDIAKLLKDAVGG